MVLLDKDLGVQTINLLRIKRLNAAKLERN